MLPSWRHVETWRLALGGDLELTAQPSRVGHDQPWQPPTVGILGRGERLRAGFAAPMAPTAPVGFLCGMISIPAPQSPLN